VTYAYVKIAQHCFTPNQHPLLHGKYRFVITLDSRLPYI
jgi:hypothetical protein